MITFKVELERENDGRWLAEVVELPGVLAYGETQEVARPLSVTAGRRDASYRKESWGPSRNDSGREMDTSPASST